MCASDPSAPELTDLMRSGRFLRVFITHRTTCARPLPAQVAHLAAQGAIDVVVLREPDLNHNAYLPLAREVQAVCAQAQVAFVLHGHVQVANDLGCTNLYLPLPHLRATGRPPGFTMLIASVHSVQEAAEARALGADVLVASPVFAPSCKPDVAGRGIAFLRELVAQANLPVLALGGITDKTEPDVRISGVAGACRMADFAQR